MNKKILMFALLGIFLIASVSAFTLLLSINGVEIIKYGGIDRVAKVNFNLNGDVSVSGSRNIQAGGKDRTAYIFDSDFISGVDSLVTVSNDGKVCVWSDDFSKKKCVKKPHNKEIKDHKD